jgi:hypothetical protein
MDEGDDYYDFTLGGRGMPNGKPISECSVSDLRDFAEFFEQVGKAMLGACEAMDAMPEWLVPR